MNRVAQINNPFLGSSLQTKSGAGFFSSLISTIISLALVLGTIVFFFMLMWGALEWITSGGDKAAVESARKRITNALIGITVLFSVWALTRIIERIFGTSILNFNILDFAIR